MKIFSAESHRSHRVSPSVAEVAWALLRKSFDYARKTLDSKIKSFWLDLTAGIFFPIRLLYFCPSSFCLIDVARPCASVLFNGRLRQIRFHLQAMAAANLGFAPAALFLFGKGSIGRDGNGFAFVI